MTPAMTRMADQFNALKMISAIQVGGGNAMTLEPKVKIS